MAAKQISEATNKSSLRKDHNRDLIRRMRNGESLTSFDSQSSWFPPRPILEKDSKAIEKLYGAQDEKSGENMAEKSENVIHLVGCED